MISLDLKGLPGIAFGDGNMGSFLFIAFWKHIPISVKGCTGHWPRISPKMDFLMMQVGQLIRKVNES